jgi:N-acetylneuraminic acid mutarotase
MAGVFFPANGKFYAMGGRMSDTAGSEFTHPLEYDPGTNSWTTKSATYPDNHVNNMACGVLTDAGTPYIYCVGGSAVTIPDISDRVFRYNPVTDVISPVAAPWPAVMGMVLPGGFTVFNNKLYILGGFDTITNGGQATNQIWEFTPSPAAWVQKSTVLPVPLGYIPTTTIGNFIYTGGGSDITAGALTDTTNSFRYDPVADSITTIAPIPRATGETRALTFCNQMYVMGGGRTAPNPSSEVDIYDPVSNTWSMGLPFTTPRRNFPTATDGTTHIWLSGGYGADGLTVLDSMEIFSCPVSPCGSPSPTPTPTATATATASATATATATASASATPTATATPGPRHTPTPRPRPTPPPRP